MPKQDSIHKNYRPVTVVTTSGEELPMRSTYNSGASGILKLDVDPKTHPAWNKDILNFVNNKSDQVNSFNSRFNGMSFLSGGKAE